MRVARASDLVGLSRRQLVLLRNLLLHLVEDVPVFGVEASHIDTPRILSVRAGFSVEGLMQDSVSRD